MSHPPESRRLFVAGSVCGIVAEGLYKTPNALLYGHHAAKKIPLQMLKVSGAATATSAIRQSEARNMRVNVRKQARHGATKDKVTRAGTLGGYEVTGWRYPEDSSWHVKVWRAGRPNEWIGYTVTAGIFELGTGDQAHKEAALHMICEWEGNN